MPCFVLGGNVDADLALVVDRVRLDDQRLRIARVYLPERVPGDAGIEKPGLLRVDDELLHLPLGDTVDLLCVPARRTYFGPMTKLS